MTKAPKTPGDSQGAKKEHQRTGTSLTTGEMAREGETPEDPKKAMNRFRRTQWKLTKGEFHNTHATRRRAFFENIRKSKHTAPLLRGMLDGKGKVFPIC
jgi:hypothetical protein